LTVCFTAKIPSATAKILGEIRDATRKEAAGENQIFAGAVFAAVFFSIQAGATDIQIFPTGPVSHSEKWIDAAKSREPPASLVSDSLPLNDKPPAE
jgi:hypothetical protein